MRKFFVKLLLRFFSALPLKVQYFNAGLIGWVMRDVVRYRKNVVIRNIADSFPEKSEEERDAIVKGFYRHLSRLIVEAVWIGGCGPRRLRRSGIVRITNPEVFNSLRSNGAGTVLLLSHHCNWELVSGSRYYPGAERIEGMDESNTVVVYRKLSDRMWDEIFAENRKACLEDPEHFEGYVETDSIIRYMFRHSGESKIYYMITDQYPYGDSGNSLSVNFLGRKTRTMSGGAAVARKFGMSVAYLSMTERPEGGYDYTYKPICGNAADMDVQTIMDRYYELLEEDIRLQPENYLWSHKRWKEINY